MLSKFTLLLFIVICAVSEYLVTFSGVINQSVSRRFSAGYKQAQLKKFTTSIIRFSSTTSVAMHSQHKNDEQYKMILKNSTDQPWHFGVYQKHPASPGLTSVAWQVRGIPPQISDIAPTAEVSWMMEFGVCIADFDKNGRKYTGTQLAPAQLGNNYQVVSIDDIPTISTTPTGTGSAYQIVLRNKTGPPAMKLSMGFTLHDRIVVVEDDVGGLQKTIFRVHPTYYVACYRNIVPGQLVDEGVVIGPIEVSYVGGFHVASVEAFKDSSGNYQLKTQLIPSAL